jgi:hypothetical protein
MQPECSADGVHLWDSRASNFFGTSHGNGFGSKDPDNVGTASGSALQVNVGGLDPDRVYIGQVRIESRTDADGQHYFYTSRAQVSFYTTLAGVIVEQWA